MKRTTPVLVGLALLLLNFAGADTQVIRLSEPVEVTSEYEVFGSPFNAAVQKIDIQTLNKSGKRYIGEPLQMTAEVSQVCQKKGCFFIARQGEETIRVSFKDYSFFVPTDIGGRQVGFNGTVMAKTLSQEDAKHYRQDLNDEAAPIEPGYTLEFVATSVKIPKPD